MRAAVPPLIRHARGTVARLELSFSSTALSGLEDSVQYHVDYPYECAEQTSSRVLPIFVLGAANKRVLIPAHLLELEAVPTPVVELA